MVRELTETEADALIAAHIRPHPSNSGLDEYWVEEPGVSVWAIIGVWLVSDHNTDATARTYRLSNEEMEAVLAFYRKHKWRIDARLAQNEEATANW